MAGAAGAGEGVTATGGAGGAWGGTVAGVGVEFWAVRPLMFTAASSVTLFLMSSSWSGGKLVLCTMPWRSRRALSLF